LIVLPLDARAQARRVFPQGENLLLSIPDDWRLGHHAERDKVRVQEFVHSSQTVQAWTRLVTVQVHDLPHSADTFVNAMTAIYKRRCPKTEVQPYAQKEVDGLTARRIFLRVPECASGVESNPVLVIPGRASLYVMP